MMMTGQQFDLRFQEDRTGVVARMNRTTFRPHPTCGAGILPGRMYTVSVLKHNKLYDGEALVELVHDLSQLCDDHLHALCTAIRLGKFSGSIAEKVDFALTPEIDDIGEYVDVDRYGSLMISRWKACLYAQNPTMPLWAIADPHFCAVTVARGRATVFLEHCPSPLAVPTFLQLQKAAMVLLRAWFHQQKSPPPCYRQYADGIRKQSGTWEDVCPQLEANLPSSPRSLNDVFRSIVLNLEVAPKQSSHVPRQHSVRRNNSFI